MNQHGQAFLCWGSQVCSPNWCRIIYLSSNSADTGGHCKTCHFLRILNFVIVECRNFSHCILTHVFPVFYILEFSRPLVSKQFLWAFNLAILLCSQKFHACEKHGLQNCIKTLQSKSSNDDMQKITLCDMVIINTNYSSVERNITILNWFHEFSFVKQPTDKHIDMWYWYCTMNI